MSDGTLSVRRRQPKASEIEAANGSLSAASLRAVTLDSFLGGVLPNIGQPRVRDRTKKKPIGDVDEFKVESKRRRRLKEYDRFLKGFKYSAALDSALRKVSITFHCSLQNLV
jgi:U3 small nucleolar RNA-associated protein 15